MYNKVTKYLNYKLLIFFTTPKANMPKLTVYSRESILYRIECLGNRQLIFQALRITSTRSTSYGLQSHPAWWFARRLLGQWHSCSGGGVCKVPAAVSSDLTQQRHSSPYDYRASYYVAAYRN